MQHNKYKHAKNYLVDIFLKEGSRKDTTPEGP